MASYSYTAIDKKGVEKKKTVEADNRDKVAELVKAEGLTLLTITEQNILTRDLNIQIGGKPKARDLSVFCRQFVSIINAGVTIIDALEMLATQTENKILNKAIMETKVNVEKGESLADAMRHNAKIFTDMFITMVAAGEASGSLDTSFSRMADQFEKQARLKSLIKKATIYPIVVGVVAVVVIIVMLTVVIPVFQTMFEQMNTQLPGITLAVIAMSKFMQSYWYLIVLFIIALVLFFRYFKKTDTGKHLFGKLAMKLPLFGKLTIKSSASRFARTLSTLLAAGLPLINALDITAETIPNVYFKEAVLDAKDDVAMGTSLSEPLTRGGIYPPLVCHMLKIGEESGNIEEMLTKLADYYDEEVETATAALTAAMEPMIIIVLAVVIGTIIISIISPMAGMYSSLSNL